MGSHSNFVLSEEDIENLETLRGVSRKEKNIEFGRRARAILLPGRDGKSRKETAEIVETYLRTVYLWQRRYRAYGVEALQPRPRPGHPKRLSPEQLQHLVDAINAGPQAAGYEGGTWTSPIVADWIQRTFDISYSHSPGAMSPGPIGFFLSISKKKLAKADPKRREEWGKDSLPQIQVAVQETQGLLFYEDEATFQQSGSTTQAWAPIGVGTEVKTNRVGGR